MRHSRNFVNGFVQDLSNLRGGIPLRFLCVLG